MNKKRYIIASVIVLIIVSMIIIVGIGALVSQTLEKDNFLIELNEEGEEITIAHISDLHVPKTGVAINELINEIEEIKPDMVFLTGDLIDSQAMKEDIESLQPFLTYIAQKAPCYAVIGNHEKINLHLDKYKNMLVQNNIKLLKNSYELTEIKGKNIAIAGLSDSAVYSDITGLNTINADIPIFLLAHRPEYWQEYISYENIPAPILTFAGHAHGGQFRIFDRGLFSPNQGFFPKYTDGLYKDNGRYMIVSRGLGDSVFPIRLYNKYHLPIVKVVL